ncbi:hypothetical protein L484_013178 [Morus notabilis]|uniref:Uncharacterized protein n=1 Tax=Morus notabilis TaxID=981085 RepID=W9RPR3_9ROSA|nr:hypothetical protein L484_013178 [Morus notabilis]
MTELNVENSRFSVLPMVQNLSNFSTLLPRSFLASNTTQHLPLVTNLPPWHFFHVFPLPSPLRNIFSFWPLFLE